MTHLIDSLIETGRQLAAAGISPGSTGNISARDGKRIYMSGTGTDLGRLEPGDIAVVDTDGVLIEGPQPSKEVSLHAVFYRKNREHSAVVHVHSPHAVAVSCLEPFSPASAVPPITPYFLMRVGQTPLIPFRAPGDPELAGCLLADPHEFRAALLANHGQITSGTDLAAALSAAVELEETCRITLLTQGHPRRLISDADIVSITRRWGTPWSAA